MVSFDIELEFVSPQTIAHLRVRMVEHVRAPIPVVVPLRGLGRLADHVWPKLHSH